MEPGRKKSCVEPASLRRSIKGHSQLLAPAFLRLCLGLSVDWTQEEAGERRPADVRPIRGESRATGAGRTYSARWWRQGQRDRLRRRKGLNLGRKEGLQPKQLIGWWWHLL